MKVATSSIETNSSYIVLKRNETFKIESKVTPVEANQSLTYKSYDSSIVPVTEKGLIKGANYGTATVLVSNEDATVAVTVIVNADGLNNKQLVSEHEKKDEEKEYSDEINTDEYEIIDEEMLKFFYDNKRTLNINGDGYIIQINGENIVNYRNELETVIQLKKSEKGMEFTINKDSRICGRITLILEDVNNGKYLYLYNNVKGKYEIITAKNISKLEIDIQGKYLITSEKL